MVILLETGRGDEGEKRRPRRLTRRQAISAKKSGASKARCRLRQVCRKPRMASDPQKMATFCTISSGSVSNARRRGVDQEGR